jgi:hypothetical protein
VHPLASNRWRFDRTPHRLDAHAIFVQEVIEKLCFFSSSGDKTSVARTATW